MKDKPTYKTSVRNLVEFILRSGDIDMRRGTSDREAMLKGGRLHRKIQKQMGSLYRAEVPLKLRREFDDLVLVLEGRADGLFEKDGMPYVDEIKGLSAGVNKLEEPVPVHLAQAKCYAVMLAADDSSPSFGIQMTYGGLEAAGGYQMRVFRSLNPDGPYVDSKGSSAVYDTYQLNFGPTENDGNRGVNIFGAYSKWGFQLTGGTEAASGERAQGHNSIIAAQDGRTYLVYHTRFQDWGEGHQVRVHQVYQNEEGWLVAAPFEYTGEGVKSAGIAAAQKVATADIPGTYKLLAHRYGLDHAAKEYAVPADVTLNTDGTLSGDGVTGTWAIKAGTSYITFSVGDSQYKGVMVPQTLEPTDTKVPCFTALDSKTGITIWGYKAPVE